MSSLRDGNKYTIYNSHILLPNPIFIENVPHLLISKSSRTQRTKNSKKIYLQNAIYLEKHIKSQYAIKHFLSCGVDG